MNKTNSEFTTFDEYIETYPKETQAKLQEIRKVIHETAPEAVETISYQIPTFKINGKGLVYFAAFKNHIGFYPFPSGIVTYRLQESLEKQYGKKFKQTNLVGPTF